MSKVWEGAARGVTKGAEIAGRGVTRGAEMVGSTRDQLRAMSGQVFHVLADNNQLHRFTVNKEGRVQLLSSLAETEERARRGWRKVVTGDPDKKIRDFMQEVPQVKFTDKLSFTFGVICIVVSEFLALRMPTLYPAFFMSLMLLLVTNRYFQYKAEKGELFMLDFCYFMNLSVAVQTSMFPDNLMWFKANYVLCMGCLMTAIVVWQNSLVFHSLDKLTSIFLHAFPPLTLHLYRWKLIPSEAIKLDDTLSFTETFVIPMILYIIWQVVYLFLIEIVFADYLASDLEIITSMRYLAKDKKNGMNNLVQAITRTMGLVGPTEEFDPETAKTKSIFIVTQGVYTVCTLIATPYLYTNYTLSFIYIAGIYCWCIWRGGSFYIEIFSERYKLKFVTMSDDHKEEYEGEEDVGDEFEDASIDLLESGHSELYEEIVTAIRAATPAASNDQLELARKSSTSSSEEEQQSGIPNKVNAESEEEGKKKSSSENSFEHLAVES